MSFFNKKEEVISIELTQYGKYLLSKGKFKPSYYEFIDDDILYDSSYGGVEESNNDVSIRIRNETPSLKPQYIFSGVETKLQQALLLLRSGKINVGSDILQQTPEKHYFSSAPLGNSALISNHMPSWKVNFLKGKVEQIQQFKTGSNPNLFIPEITSKTIEYKIKSIEQGQDIQLQPDDLITNTFQDNSYIKLVGDSIIIEIDEENTPVMNSNFHIEMYVLDKDPDTEEEKLVPLYFPQKQSSIENNLLIGDGTIKQDLEETLDPKYAEYFLTINVDHEISTEISDLLPDSKQKKLQIFPSNNNNIKYSK